MSSSPHFVTRSCNYLPHNRLIWNLPLDPTPPPPPSNPLLHPLVSCMLHWYSDGEVALCRETKREP